jgi:hypothetical protein
VGAGSCKDFVWSKEFVREFLGRSCRTEELSLDECLASDLEFRCRVPSGISGSLVTTLGFGNILLEFLMKLVEVSDKVTCACGSEIALGMNGNVWVVTLVGKEGRNTGGCTWRVVEGELG